MTDSRIPALIAELREARERMASIEMNTGCMRGQKERGTQFCAEAQDLSAQLREARKALEEIAKGEGEFSRDPLQHAGNVMENMKGIARRALATKGDTGNE